MDAVQRQFYTDTESVRLASTDMTTVDLHRRRIQYCYCGENAFASIALAINNFLCPMYNNYYPSNNDAPDAIFSYDVTANHRTLT